MEVKSVKKIIITTILFLSAFNVTGMKRTHPKPVFTIALEGDELNVFKRRRTGVFLFEDSSQNQIPRGHRVQFHMPRFNPAQQIIHAINNEKLETVLDLLPKISDETIVNLTDRNGNNLFHLLAQRIQRDDYALQVVLGGFGSIAQTLQQPNVPRVSFNQVQRLVTLLSEKGVNINVLNDEGKPPIAYLVACPNIQYFKLFIHHGVSFAPDQSGNNIFHYLCQAIPRADLRGVITTRIQQRVSYLLEQAGEFPTLLQLAAKPVRNDNHMYNQLPSNSDVRRKCEWYADKLKAKFSRDYFITLIAQKNNTGKTPVALVRAPESCQTKQAIMSTLNCF